MDAFVGRVGHVMMLALVLTGAATLTFMTPAIHRTPPRSGHGPLSHRGADSAGWIAATVAVGFLLAATAPPVVAAIVLGAGLVGQSLARTRRARARRRRYADQLPDVIMLMAIGLLAGQSIREMTHRLGARVSGAHGGVLAEILHRERLGQPLLEAFGEVAEPDGLGRVVPLLRSQLEDGAAVADQLLELAVSLRDERRRLAEVRARRLPVRMLWPMITCVLPGFLALTVAPVIIESIREVQF